MVDMGDNGDVAQFHCGLLNSEFGNVAGPEGPAIRMRYISISAARQSRRWNARNGYAAAALPGGLAAAPVSAAPVRSRIAVRRPAIAKRSWSSAKANDIRTVSSN